MAEKSVRKAPFDRFAAAWSERNHRGAFAGKRTPGLIGRPAKPRNPFRGHSPQNGGPHVPIQLDINYGRQSV